MVLGIERISSALRGGGLARVPADRALDHKDRDVAQEFGVGQDVLDPLLNARGNPVSKVPQLGELFGSQIDDLCGKHSVLVRKRNDGRHSLLF